MMNKKVYLHIGIGKTGTTSIQDMLYHYRLDFLKKGLYYPEDGLYKSAHHLLANLPGGEGGTQPIKKCLKKIKTEFLKNDYDKLLISSEQLCYTTKETIAAYYELFSDCDVQVIMYIRRQDKLLQSAFLEYVKSGLDYKGTIEEYFNYFSASFNFIDRLYPWVDCFGKNRMSVRLYDRRQITDVCTDFLKCLDIGTITWKIKRFDSYPSLHPIIFPTISLFDELSIQKEDRKELITHLLQLSEKVILPKESSLISDKFREIIYKRYLDSNRIIAEQFLNQSDTKYFLDWSDD